VAGEDHATAFRGADRREQIGLAGSGIAAQRRSDAEAAEIEGDPLDQRQVRARRGGVEGDEPLEDVEGRA